MTAYQKVAFVSHVNYDCKDRQNIMLCHVMLRWFALSSQKGG